VSGRRGISLRNYHITNEEEKPQTESSVLSMKFKVRKHHVHHGKMHVRCNAAIMNIYQESKKKEEEFT
jgi:hypothetical protein